MFFEGFPEFLPNEFYVTGESYGGVYVPWLTTYIKNYNALSTTTSPINLKGMTVGNGLTNMTADLGQETQADFLWWHALYGQTVRDDYEKNCVITPDEDKCNNTFEVMSNLTTNINPYDIYRVCYHENFMVSHREFMNRFNEPLKDDPNGAPCIDSRGANKMFNDKDVRTAFNVGDQTTHWTTCRLTANYTYTFGESIQLYPDLIRSNPPLKLLFYSGDTDSTIAVTGSMKWIHWLRINENLVETEAWRQWNLDGQVGGYTHAFNDTFAFATIKGTGHMSIQWKRPQGYHIFNSFLNNTRF